MTNHKVAGLVAIGAGVAVAVWLLSQIIKNAGKDVTYYRCPDCGRMIKPYTNPCPWCETPLVWESSNVKKSSSNFLGTLGIFIGFCFSLVMCGICTFCKPEHLEVWTHSLAGFGGYIVAMMKFTIDSPV